MEATTIVTALPCVGMWNAYVRRMMDPEHRLVRRWCAHLEFEDVLRIDHGSIHAAHSDPARALGAWRIAFGNARVPATIVPARLVNVTQQHILDRARVCSIAARHDEPVFDESFGEPITRTSLSGSIRRALVLVRLSDALLSGKVASR